MKEQIDRKMSFGDMFARFPEKKEALAEILNGAGLGCVGCAAASFESLEEGFRAHGIGEEEINALLAKLNKIVSE